MKKLIAIFSVLAMFSTAAIAQDPPKNTVKKKPVATAAKGKKLNRTKANKASKAPANPANINPK